MATIQVDDELINELIAVSHYQNAQEVVIRVLSDYLQQCEQPNFFEQLRLAEDCADDEVALLFERDKGTDRNREI